MCAVGNYIDSVTELSVGKDSGASFGEIGQKQQKCIRVVKSSTTRTTPGVMYETAKDGLGVELQVKNSNARKQCNNDKKKHSV